MPNQKRYMLAVGLALALGLVPAAALRAQEGTPRPSSQIVAAAPSPEKLPDILAEGAAKLQKNIGALKLQQEAWKQTLTNLAGEKADLQARTAALNASMAVGELTLAEAQETLQDLSEKELATTARLKGLLQRQTALDSDLQGQTTSFAAVKELVAGLVKSRHPVHRSPEMQKAYQQYQSLAAEYAAAAKKGQEVLRESVENLQAQQSLLTETKTKLEKDYLEKALEREVLQRQTLQHRLEHLKQIAATLAALPGKSQAWLVNAMQSRALLFFIGQNWADLIGLALFLALLGAGTRRLKKVLLPGLAAWQEQVPELSLKLFLTFLQILVRRLFSVGFVAWLYLAFWKLGLLQAKAAWLVWSLTANLVALRLVSHLVHRCFAGEEAGGVLPVPGDLARFYRRHLRLLAGYFFLLGSFVVHNARVLGFAPETAGSLRTFFQVVLLGWVLWLLRSRYLDSLLAVLPVPAILKNKTLLQMLRGAAVLVFAFVVVSGLLGFKFLSDYVAQGASFTLMVVAIAWILGEGAHAVLRLVLHPERGALAQKYPKRQQLFMKSSRVVTQTVKIVLAGVAVLLTLKVWGVSGERLAPVFTWLSWGPALGPIRFSPLNIGVAVLIVYLGLWASRVLRAFMELKFFPGTDWDPGIHYTISMTSHYVILVITILLAMNAMGVSFTSLALVAGGLGVGIGFGLQNIVSNFLSGLILLFERPIKVGDMLVIDGQWGMVKEIRVRSTIFQAFDKYFLIIPNSDLISGKILNWTYAGWGLNRLGLKVGVSYDSDPRQVTNIIEEVCRANPRVVSEPPPQTYFEAYGDSSLNFHIWVHLASPGDRIPATHELNSAIFEAFRTHGIEIPFPQRDLHVRSWSPEAPPSVLPTSKE